MPALIEMLDDDASVKVGCESSTIGSMALSQLSVLTGKELPKERRAWMDFWKRHPSDAELVETLSAEREDADQLVAVRMLVLTRSPMAISGLIANLDRTLLTRNANYPSLGQECWHGLKFLTGLRLPHDKRVWQRWYSAQAAFGARGETCNGTLLVECQKTL